MTCQTYRRWRRTRGLREYFRSQQECLTRSSAAPQTPTGSLNLLTSPQVLRAPCWKMPPTRGSYIPMMFDVQENVEPMWHNRALCVHHVIIVFVQHWWTGCTVCGVKYPQQLRILFCIQLCKWLKWLPHASHANLISTSCSPKRHPHVISLFNHHQYQADVWHSFVRHYWLNQSVIKIVACKFKIKLNTYYATNSFSCDHSDHCFLCRQIISSPHIWQQ